MLQWKAIAYGTLIFTNAVLTNDLVWFDNDRERIDTVDFVEIFQGARERIRVTSLNDSPLFSSIDVTNWNFNFDTLDPSGAEWLSYDSSSAKTTNKFYTVSSTNMEQRMAPDPEPTPSNHRFDIESERGFRVIDKTKKFIWGGYSNITLNGFSTSYSKDVNGGYTFNSRYEVSAPAGVPTTDGVYPYSTIVDKYIHNSQTNLAIYDYNNLMGSPLETLYADQFLGLNGLASWVVADADNVNNYYVMTQRGVNMKWGQWHDSEPFIPLITGSEHVSMSNLRTNYIRDAYAYNVEYWTNTISEYISFDMYNQLSKKIIYCFDERTFGVEDFTPYVDHTLATNGEFIGFTDLPSQVSSNVWDRLGFTNFAFLFPETLGIFDDQEGFEPEVNQHIIISTNWMDRYKTMQEELKWTRNTVGNELRWFAVNSTTNHYVWQGQSTSSWADAIAIATTNIIFAAISNEPPWMGTTGVRASSNNWIATAYARTSVLGLETNIIKGLHTDITNAVDYYNNAGSFFTNNVNFTNTVFDNNGETVSNTFMIRFDQLTINSNAFVTSNLAIGTTNIPVWCDEPFVGTNTAKGFMVTNQDFVIKWNFLYCTNALP